MKKFLALFAMFGLIFVSCSDDDTVVDTTPPMPDPITITSGSANFSNYVALGNSLTAGFSDAALFQSGQVASYPNMLASNFALAGGGDFNIPLMADDLGGATINGESDLNMDGRPDIGNRLILSFESGSPAPVPVEGQGTTEILNVLSGPFNNMGVPGAKSYHLLAPGYGNAANLALGAANPYFVRFASEPNATVLGDAAAQNPTFFSLWIGNNDVLGYVTAGGAGVDQTGNIDPSTYVPDVTTIPFLTTVPYNPVPLDAGTAALLNGAYAAYNGGLAQLQQLGAISAEEVARRTISFEAGASNAVVLLDEDLTDLTGFNPALINMRQSTPDDLLTLTSSTFIGTLANPADPTSINGVAVPLADNWVLTPEEQATANAALTVYNQTIAALAVQYDIAFVDANALLVELGTNGFTLSDGSMVTATFGTGGGFSLDGVHPSPRGYAILANAFAEAINTKYGSNLPGVNPLGFTGLYLE